MILVLIVAIIIRVLFFLLLEAISECLLQIDLKLFYIGQHFYRNVADDKEELRVVRVLQVATQWHRLNTLNHVHRLVPERVHLVLISPSEALSYDQIDEELGLLVGNPLAHVKKAI